MSANTLKEKKKPVQWILNVSLYEATFFEIGFFEIGFQMHIKSQFMLHWHNASLPELLCHLQVAPMINGINGAIEKNALTQEPCNCLLCISQALELEIHANLVDEG